MTELTNNSAPDKEAAIKPLFKTKAGSDHRHIGREMGSVVDYMDRTGSILEYAARLKKENVIFHSFINQLPFGMVIIDQALNIIACNQSGSMELGLDRLHPSGEKIGEIDPRFKQAVSDLHGSSKGRREKIAVIQMGRKRHYLSRIRMNNADIPGNEKACYFLMIPNGQFDIMACHCDFTARYSLTQRETEILNRMIKGDCAKQIAQDDRVKENTVRQQMKQIYSKTQTHGQLELVSMALRDPATIIVNTLLNKAEIKRTNRPARPLISERRP